MRVPTDAEVIAASVETPSLFGAVFDRHATTLFRYLVRRVGPDEADSLLGELFRVAFERRHAFDTTRAEARPWLYGIATNLLAKHHRGEARRINAMARLRASGAAAVVDAAEDVADRLDAATLWPAVAQAISGLPDGERDALILHAWEGLGYEQVALALGIPVGTVRSRLNRARGRLRELTGPTGEQQMTTALRPDRLMPVDEGNPAVFKREKEKLMSDIGVAPPEPRVWNAPAMYPRLAYRDEAAALEYLTRVFQFVERREARMGEPGDPEEGMLAWLEFGDGIVMIGRASEAASSVHHLHATQPGHATVVIHVAVHDIDSHYAHASSEGATITMPIEDAFYGFRRYEADDLEGHHWHFHESLAEIRARGGKA